MAVLTQARLKELFHYEPKTGIFTKLITTGSQSKVGDICGCLSDTGYLRIQINGIKHRSHRLAWLYMEGYFPEHVIDHINGITADNRWCNLRHVTQLCNMQNKPISKRNTSGYTGVMYRKREGKWASRIRHKGKEYGLGYYDTALNAALARIAAEDCLPDFHCDNRSDNRKKVFNALRGI